ncbi:MAG: histidine kinase [Planctomycetales bacterium 4484_113]|nr:MAG: histidine kinase [Planctomycetales bacterium 4484_113]
MHTPLRKREEREETFKQLIRELHEGADIEQIKERFRKLIGGTSPVEIAQIEERLIKEGMPVEEIHRLCDVHIALFQESLEQEQVLAPEGHPIRILMEEHKLLLGFAGELTKAVQAVKDAGSLDAAAEHLQQLGHLAEQLEDSEKHYLREENVLFPYLEKHGVTQPPKIMWMEHDRIREIKKSIFKLVGDAENADFPSFVSGLEEAAITLSETLAGHFTKENKILFPAALKVIGEQEWTEIRRQFDEIGYCCFTPKAAIAAIKEEKMMETPAVEPEVDGKIALSTGSLSRVQLEAILNALPVDISFVDQEDSVRYFNDPGERIFVRTKAVLGRKVQHCHPQRSLHAVEQILEDFKSGKRNVAEFWINLKDRLVHIRYFPVRDKDGEYLGTLEVTQDVTDIRKLEGEKRLL